MDDFMEPENMDSAAESAIEGLEQPELSRRPGVAFPAGNSDFRAVRNRCMQACRIFNETPEDAPPVVRSRLWLDIIRPVRDRSNDGTPITHDEALSNPCKKGKAQTPFVKPPFFADYGLRLAVGGSTFINRGCMIMDTPVADITIGRDCNIGPNCVLVGVSHEMQPQARLAEPVSIGRPITIGDNVWIGANVTILDGITIGDGAVIGAGSVVTKNIPSMTLAHGVPARIIQSLENMEPTMVSDTVTTLGGALAHNRNLCRKDLEMEINALDGLSRGSRVPRHAQPQRHEPPILRDQRASWRMLCQSETMAAVALTAMLFALMNSMFSLFLLLGAN